MAGKDSPYIAEFRKAVETWSDERFVSREDLYACSMFIQHLVNLAESDGWEYTGHSFSVKLPMSLLVVRGNIDGVAHVVFSSGRTTAGCIRAFLRKMEEGWLEWSVDRFR